VGEVDGSGVGKLQSAKLQVTSVCVFQSYVNERLESYELKFLRRLALCAKYEQVGGLPQRWLCLQVGQNDVAQ
jgi:hypothetical protein